MKLYLSIIILPLLCGVFEIKAQAQEQLSTMPEQWQLTVDVIKSKAQRLMLKNDGLQDQYRQLKGQVQEYSQAIDNQQYKNEQMIQFIQERHGRTDQMLRIDELTQIVRAKRLEARAYEEQWEILSKKQMKQDDAIQQLKYTISSVELHQQAEKQQLPIVPPKPLPLVDDQLIDLRKQVEYQNKQEVVLQNQLDALKAALKVPPVNGDVRLKENKELQAQLDLLRLKKLRHVKELTDAELAAANARMFDHLKKHKMELENNINAYESRMDELKRSSVLAISWPFKRKKMVHDMVVIDARNNQLRDQIKSLHDDIDVLRDQVARLERRVDFVQDKKIQQ